MMARDCKHGQLARSCYTCELESDNVRLRELHAKDYAELVGHAEDAERLRLENKRLLEALAQAAAWLGVTERAWILDQADLTEAEAAAALDGKEK